MKNRMRLAAFGLVAAMCLGACGGGTDENGRGRMENDGNGDTPEETVREMPAEAETPTEAAAPVEAAEGVFAEAFAQGKVENNGGYFVRVGDQVYYRVYDERGLHRNALFGEFLSGDVPTAPSTLVAYDLKSGETETVTTMYGDGKLYAGVDGFFLANSETNETYLYPVDGSEWNLYCKGTPRGVSADGRSLLVTQYPLGPGYKNGDVLYRDGQEIAEVSLDKLDFEGFCGFAGEDAIMYCRETEDADWKILSIDKDGKQTDLGVIDLSDADEWIKNLYPEPEQILYDEEGVYLTFGYYDGTGHMLADWVMLSAKPGVADSVEMLEVASRADDVDVDTVPKMLLTGPGEIETYKYVGGEVELSEGYYGDLVYYDSPFGAMILKEDYLPQEEAEGETDGKQFLLDAQVFDDTAFLITAYGTHNEQNDIGWRWSYDLVYMEYYSIPFDAAHLENGIPKEMNSLEFLTSTGWAEGAINYDDLVGKWKLESYETEGYCGSAEEDGVDTHLTCRSDGTLLLEEMVEGAMESREFTKLTGDEENIYISMDESDEENVMQIELVTAAEDQLEVYVSFWYSEMSGSSWILVRE